MKQGTVVTIVLCSCMLVSTSAAQVPTLKPVPQNASEELRDKLQQRTRELNSDYSELERLAREYKEKYVGRPLTKSELPAAKAAGENVKNKRSEYTADANAFNKVVDAIKKISRNQEAFRRLGFAKRADEFAEWEKLAEDSRVAFKKELVQISVDLMLDEAAALTALGAGKVVSRWTMRDANRWIRTLKKTGVKNEWLFQELRKFGAAGNREARVQGMKDLIAATSQAVQSASKETEGGPALEKMETLAKTFVDGVAIAHGPVMRALVSDLEFTSAAVFKNATQRVSRARINDLVEMTEEQLKAVQKLSELMKKDVDALSEAVKEFDALSEAAEDQ